METTVAMERTGELAANSHPLAWVGIAVMIGMYVLEEILISKGYFRPKRERKMEAAKAAGRMIQAHQVKCYCSIKDDSEDVREYTYTATYEYKVNGRTHKTSVVSKNAEPPSVITMYYESDPEKAFSDYQTGGAFIQIVETILPLLTAVAVTSLLEHLI